MFSGSNVALVTPFCNNQVDIDALAKIIEWQIEEGTDGILVCGSTGEGLLLSEKERFEIIHKSIQVARKRAKIIVGCSACSTAEAIKLTEQAEELEADGVLVIAPYYVKPTQNGIIKHFTEVHENSNIPIILYNNPGRCAVNMTIDTIVELAKLPRIVGLKDSDTDLSKATFIKSKIPNFTLLSGDDPTLAGYLAHGGDGAISVTANIEPSLVKQLIDSWKKGDIKTMQNISQKLAPLSEVMFVESNPIPAKYALFKKRLLKNELRLPLTAASKLAMEKIDAVLDK